MPKHIRGRLLSPSYVIVWFQCPWLDDRDKIGDLIEQFLMNTLHTEDLVCVGIMNNEDYIDACGLEDILGKELIAGPDSTAVFKYYNFRGADDQLVREILRYGYHHQSLKDAHCTSMPNQCHFSVPKKFCHLSYILLAMNVDLVLCWVVLQILSYTDTPWGQGSTVL